ncbi:MAG: HAD family hydrolase [Jhaorihella sp.]
MRIAMWSGPRNLSTAMMYAFAARGDCAVWDEPFYAPYLKATGLDHPMAAEIMAAHETDAYRVAAACAGPIPGGKPHFYMKHMPHHMLDGFPTGWFDDCVHVHLIRHPARVIASYAAKREAPVAEDIGYAQQLALHRRIGGIVIDSHDIRDDPETMLKRLCGAIGLPFSTAMLHWPAGGRPEDGIWARHWYGAVHQSRGIAGAEGPLPQLSGDYANLCQTVLPAYEAMKARALKSQ